MFGIIDFVQTLVPLQAQSAITPYDPLIVSLVILAIGGALGALFLLREVRGTHGPDDRGSFAWLFGLIGFISLLLSGELFWANWAGFPAQQYTELFGVAQTMFAVVMLAAAFVIYTDLDPKPFTWLTGISGLVQLQGANAIFAFGLTKSPIVATGIWLTAGLAEIGLLPAAYADPDSDARTYLVYLVAALLIVMAVLSLITAVGGHYSHIAEAASK